jgi:DNA-directed RNA polymerase specialized sigma24 family protein
MPKKTTLASRIPTLTAWLVFLIALGSFVLSYNALKQVASDNGIGSWQSTIWPLLIDFSLIVFSLAVVRAHLESESTWYAWLLVGLYTVATVSFNVYHAPPGLAARLIAAVAPVSLFLSFELLMSQLKRHAQRQQLTLSLSQLAQEGSKAQAHNDTLQAHANSLRAKIDELEAKLKQAENELAEKLKESHNKPEPTRDTTNKTIPAKITRQAQIKERQAQVGRLVSQGLTLQEIADRLNVSLATVKRDNQALNNHAHHAPHAPPILNGSQSNTG